MPKYLANLYMHKENFRKISGKQELRREILAGARIREDKFGV